MSKIGIGVGDEFPLDEPQGDRRAFDYRGRHWRHHHGHHHYHGHRQRGFGGLAFLLVLAGTVGLIVEHQLTRTMALGMIGAGIGLWVLMFGLRVLWHWRHHRRAGQVS